MALAPEQQKVFKDKRKQHYNEYSKVKLARKLIEQELKDLEDDNDTSTDAAKEGPSSPNTSADSQVRNCTLETFSIRFFLGKRKLQFAVSCLQFQVARVSNFSKENF